MAPVLISLQNITSLYVIKFSSSIYVFCGVSLLIVITAHLFLIGMIANVHRIIFRSNTITHENTLRLQKILHTSCIIEMLTSTILLTLPIEIVFVLFIFHMPYTGPLFTMVLALSSFETFLTICFTCYFVTPFRKWILSKLKNFHPHQIVGALAIANPTP
jgi:hypothetical protein